MDVYDLTNATTGEELNIDNKDIQHSLGWYRARLGKITGSKVGELMKSGRNDIFSETAKSYIYKLAGERLMNSEIVHNDCDFEQYLAETNVSTRAMRWGTEQEQSARILYCELTNRNVSEIGLKEHKTIANFASSPDGYVENENGSIEIKCFEQGKFTRLCEIVIDNETLKNAEPIIFYQCMAHIMCNGTDWCDFVLYNPFQRNPIKIVRIMPDENVFAEMEQKIKIANEMIEQITNR